MHPECGSISRELARLSELDSDFLVFGSDHHRYCINSPASQEQISGFEDRHGISLPTDFRAFLSDVANGGAGPDYGVYSLHEIAKELFTGLREDELPDPGRAFDAPRSLQRARDMEYPANGILPISDIGCGMMSLLVVTGPEAGNMWCLSNDSAYLPYTTAKITFPHESSIEERIRIGDDHAAATLVSSDRMSFFDWYISWLDRSFDDLQNGRLEHRQKRRRTERKWWHFW